MPDRQVIITTVFGPKAESIAKTFATFTKVPNAQLHVFVYNPGLPRNRHPQIAYHLVTPEPALVSVRRDALFRRWILPDGLDADYALVVDGTDAICIHPLPPFRDLLRGASVAGAPEWGPPVRVLGQGFTSTYINGGVTFWDLKASAGIRQQIVLRGRQCYRGPFDDQTTLNEVVNTSFFDQLTVLPPQFNWRALYKKNFRSWHHNFRNWPRVDSLDGVQIYHNQHCVDEVLAAIANRKPEPKASLPELPADTHPLSNFELLKRRLAHRLLYN